MGFKNFIKPTKKKMITFIVLFIVVFLIPYIKVEDTLNQGLLQQGHYPIILFFLASLIFFFTDLSNGRFYIEKLSSFLIFIFLFFIVYLVSCGIINFYENKFTKNNKI